MAKRIPILLIVVVLILSLSVATKWVRERHPPLSTARKVAGNNGETSRQAADTRESVDRQKANDCGEWARMSFRQKQANYRTDPERWGRCLCEGENCELDRLYLTGRRER